MHKDIKDILERIESGQYNEQEEQIAKFWLFKLKNTELEPLSEAELAETSQDIWNQLQLDVNLPDRKLFPWLRFITVAAAVLILAFGAYFYYDRQALTVEDATYLTHDLQPGRNGATLTLGDGRQIKLTDLSNGTVAQESGIHITKSADGQLIYETNGDGLADKRENTLSTSNGETYQVRLPDGTKVWLNAGSSLTYSSQLVHDGQRKVKLTGEAYFEVTHDTGIPFVVKGNKQTVLVVGTKFNVTNYANEDVARTTLLSGSVQIHTTKGGQLLQPGQEASVSEGYIRVKKVYAEDAIAWVKGRFRFDNTSLEDIMKKIERWYDVEVIYPNGIPDKRFTGGINRNDNISSVLKMLNILKVNFRIEGKKIIVLK